MKETKIEEIPLEVITYFKKGSKGYQYTGDKSKISEYMGDAQCCNCHKRFIYAFEKQTVMVWGIGFVTLCKSCLDKLKEKA